MTAATTPKALMNHPLVLIACRMMRRIGGGRWTLDEGGARVIELAILKERNDPRLDGAILGLFEVAVELQEKKRSPAAAGMLLAVLGRIGPALAQRDQRIAARATARERAVAAFRRFTEGR
jgi:hypothetical protein